MSRKRFLALPALVLAVGLVAGPADASRQDSWLGNPFMWHINDVIAFPHRAAQDDWQNEAAAVFVPNSISFSPDPRGSEAAEALLQGTATFGRDNWGIIIAANDNRGYNPVKGIGAGYDPRSDFGDQLPDSRRPADYLTMPSSAYFSTYGLGGSMSANMPRTRMQVGLGYGLEAVDLGLFWTMANSQNTTETNDGAGNTTKTGTEAGYNSFTLSGGLNLSAFTSFELALSFTTGSQERFGTAGNTGVGTGDNSAFAFTWQGHLDRSWLGWTPAFIFTYGQCSADFQETQAAGATPPADNDELETSSIRIDFGGKRSWEKADVAVDLGFQLETTKDTFTQGGGGTQVDTDETTHTLFPVCGASGTYWPWGWFGIDGGVLFVFDSIEDKDEANPGGGGAVSTDTDNDITMDSEFGFGLVFRIARETWGADFAANVRNDVLSDPGTLFQGGFGTSPIFSIESALHW